VQNKEKHFEFKELLLWAKRLLPGIICPMLPNVARQQNHVTGAKTEKVTARCCQKLTPNYSLPLNHNNK